MNVDQLITALTVDQLITALQKVDDKTMPVTILFDGHYGQEFACDVKYWFALTEEGKPIKVVAIA